MTEEHTLVFDVREAPLDSSYSKYAEGMRNLEERTEILVKDCIPFSVIKPVLDASSGGSRDDTSQDTSHETHTLTLDRREGRRGVGLVDEVLRTHPALESSLARYVDAWSKWKAGQNARDFLADPAMSTCLRTMKLGTLRLPMPPGTRCGFEGTFGDRPPCKAFIAKSGRGSRYHGSGCQHHDRNVLASNLTRALYSACWFGLRAFLADVLVKHVWRPQGPNFERMLALAGEEDEDSACAINQAKGMNRMDPRTRVGVPMMDEADEAPTPAQHLTV